jgi:hypothetical protein
MGEEGEKHTGHKNSIYSWLESAPEYMFTCFIEYNKQ